MDWEHILNDIVLTYTDITIVRNSKFCFACGKENGEGQYMLHDYDTGLSCEFETTEVEALDTICDLVTRRVRFDDYYAVVKDLGRNHYDILPEDHVLRQHINGDVYKNTVG